MTELREVAWMLAPLRRAPREDAALDTEALRGEAVEILEPEDEGWVRARLVTDGYEGFIPAAALRAPGPPATHVVAVARTLAFPAPDFKRPPMAALTMGARVHIVREVGRYTVTDHGEHLVAAHLMPAGEREADPVAVAEKLLGAPYLWGGKSALGVDCSGLVQLAFARCGVVLPRDSGPQEASAGTALALDGPFGRGDLLFWPGHVAIARGDGAIIHANATHMMVAIEDTAGAIPRIAASGTPLRSARRVQ
jgi:cell wall-associated NlpC family hydrolase